MKTNYLSLLLLSCFIIGCNNEVPPNINLEELCGTYQGDTRIIRLNGEEYLTDIINPVKLLFNIPESGEGIMEFFYLWPYPQTLNPFDSRHIEIQTAATPTEVILKGNYSDSPYYTVGVEGKWAEGMLEVDLDYKSIDERLVGNTFIVCMNEDALDFSRLYPSSNTVEFGGQQIPIENFVRDAMSPIFRALSKNLGAEIKLIMKEDGNMEISTKKIGNNNFTNIPGKHRHWLHSDNHGYFEADYEGASWLLNRLHEDDFISKTSPIFGDKIGTQCYASILYYFDDGDLVYCNQNWGGTKRIIIKYLALLLDSYRLLTTGTYNMTLEEREKISTLKNLIQDGIIQGDIYIRAKKQ